MADNGGFLNSPIGPFGLTGSDLLAIIGPSLASIPIHTGHGVNQRTFYPFLPLGFAPQVLQARQASNERAALAKRVREAIPGAAGELAAAGYSTGQPVSADLLSRIPNPGAYDQFTSFVNTFPKDSQAYKSGLDIAKGVQAGTIDTQHAYDMLPKIYSQEQIWRLGQERVSQGEQRLTQSQQRLNQSASRLGNQFISDDEAQFRAQQAIQGDRVGAFLGLGYGNSRAMNSQKVHDAMRAMGYTGSDVVVNSAQLEASRKELSNLQVYRGRLNVALKTLDNNIRAAMPYIDRGVAGQFPVTNKVINAVREGKGDPTFTRFELALYTIATEYGRAMSGAASNGMLPEGARTDATQLLNPNMNAEQVKAVIDQMLKHTEAVQEASGGAIDQVRDEIRNIGGSAAGPRTAAPDGVSAAGHRTAAPGGESQGVVDWSTLK